LTSANNISALRILIQVFNLKVGGYFCIENINPSFLPGRWEDLLLLSKKKAGRSAPSQ
jgi:hypothetical protein